MAVADTLVLRQPNETSGSPIECEHSDPSDQAILTRGTAFGKTLQQGRQCFIVSSGTGEIRTGRSTSLQWRAGRIVQWSRGTKVRKIVDRFRDIISAMRLQTYSRPGFLVLTESTAVRRTVRASVRRVGWRPG